LGDATRVRLLALLEREELTVAELSSITHLAQPRVSTHLAKLREAGMVVDRRAGVSVYYRLAEDNHAPDITRVWQTFQANLDDALVNADAERLMGVLAERAAGRSWADSVAGDMERHYSPGRTWEATAHALTQLLGLGRVLDMASGDGVMAELLASQATTIDCLDLSAKVVEAGRRRNDHLEHVRFHEGDMHDLPFKAHSFDTVLLLHALTYSDQPKVAIAQAARVLAPGGRLVCATLHRHAHSDHVKAFGHVQSGFVPETLSQWLTEAGLQVEFCGVTSIERKPPHFQILTALANKSR
jgi:ArsR family transcriptional regulator